MRQLSRLLGSRTNIATWNLASSISHSEVLFGFLNIKFQIPCIPDLLKYILAHIRHALLIRTLNRELRKLLIRLILNRVFERILVNLLQKLLIFKRLRYRIKLSIITLNSRTLNTTHKHVIIIIIRPIPHQPSCIGLLHDEPISPRRALPLGPRPPPRQLPSNPLFLHSHRLTRCNLRLSFA